jgi:hypothetical protein
MIAPVDPSPLPLKLASVIEASRVPGVLSLTSPLKVNVDTALLSQRGGSKFAGVSVCVECLVSEQLTGISEGMLPQA